VLQHFLKHKRPAVQIFEQQGIIGLLCAVSPATTGATISAISDQTAPTKTRNPRARRSESSVTYRTVISEPCGHVPNSHQ
jgi:hypothetical protein